MGNIHNHKFVYRDVFKRCFGISIDKLDRIKLDSSDKTSLNYLTGQWHSRKLKNPERYDDILELYLYCLSESRFTFNSSNRHTLHRRLIYHVVDKMKLMHQKEFVKEFIRQATRNTLTMLTSEYMDHLHGGKVSLSQYYQEKLLKLYINTSGKQDINYILDYITSDVIYDNIIREIYRGFYLSSPSVSESNNKKIMKAYDRVGKRSFPILLGEGDLSTNFMQDYIEYNPTRVGEISKLVASNLSKDINYYNITGVYGIHNFMINFTLSYDRVYEFIENHGIRLSYFNIDDFSVDQKINLIDIHQNNNKEKLMVEYDIMQ
jgi:hypothetical protein